MTGRIHVYEDRQAMALHVAEWMTSAALSSRGVFRVALSGGSTPRPLYETLAAEPFRDRFPWSRVNWYWGDERFVPRDDPANNYRMANEALLSRVPAPPEGIFPIPVDGRPEEAAIRYERILQDAYGSTDLDPARPLFDVVLLGLGPDGHTASLLPGETVLDEKTRWVVAVTHGRPETRITLTYPVLESCRTAAFLVSGEEKAPVFGEIRAGKRDVPAGRLRPVGQLHWFVDRSAAGDSH